MADKTKLLSDEQQRNESLYQAADEMIRQLESDEWLVAFDPDTYWGDNDLRLKTAAIAVLMPVLRKHFSGMFARERQYAELVAADKELTEAMQAIGYRSVRWPIPEELAFRKIKAMDRKAAALAALSPVSPPPAERSAE